VSQKNFFETELLAPAGGFEAACAAFQYGANAVYLGLGQFSARADAENFSWEGLEEITAYAHALQPARRVFVTLNTVVLENELEDLLRTLCDLEEIGVDALIVQDLGIAHLVRRYFPRLQLHGSTQMAVHGRAGVETLKALGFARVILARELTLEEIRDAASVPGIETEVFVHGALCYGYSGLCLFSSHMTGRSGNRGRCAYCCRDQFETIGEGVAPWSGMPFSMKDMALSDHLEELCTAGVDSLKIEGRKKSPLYVATVTDFYRKMLDGGVPPAEKSALEADLRTVFSRPQTSFFVEGRRHPEVVDQETVGHRGVQIGQVARAVRPAERTLCFVSDRALEKHDGIQIDLPGEMRPFGFPINDLNLVENGGSRNVITTPAGSRVEIGLPPGHPALPMGAPIYCASSQAVKKQFRVEQPKRGQYRRRMPLTVELELAEDELGARASTVPWFGSRQLVTVRHALPGPFAEAKNTAGQQRAFDSVFAKLGETRFDQVEMRLSGPAKWFVPVSLLNQFRRELLEKLETAVAQQHEAFQDDLCRREAPVAELPAEGEGSMGWILKIDRVAAVEAFDDEDWNALGELILDIGREPLATIEAALRRWEKVLDRDRIRLALPVLTRQWQDAELRHKVETLRGAGWERWELANLAGWQRLGLPVDATAESAERLRSLSADWTVYALNRGAVRQLQRMGVDRVTLSPEDSGENMRQLLEQFGPSLAVVVYQDTPMLFSEVCAFATIAGACPAQGKAGGSIGAAPDQAGCGDREISLRSSHGKELRLINDQCRTVALNREPFSLGGRLPELEQAGARFFRADFLWRAYAPEEVRGIWRDLRAGRAIPGTYEGNYARGLK
jgi:putative protease